MTGGVSDEELAGLLRQAEEAADVWMRGDMERYLELVHHAPGFTLLNPLGGPASRYDDRSTSLREAASSFADGDARLEAVETHAWGDTVVLVAIERQHGRVGGLPPQEWSLRVTHVFRRVDGDWQLVHRHADPLAHRIDLEQLSAIARGASDSAEPT